MHEIRHDALDSYTRAKIGRARACAHACQGSPHAELWQSRERGFAMKKLEGFRGSEPCARVCGLELNPKMQPSSVWRCWADLPKHV